MSDGAFFIKGTLLLTDCIHTYIKTTDFHHFYININMYVLTIYNYGKYSM